MEYINAFWVGGLICALVQILLDRTELMPGRIERFFWCVPGQYLAHLESMNQFRNMRAPVRAFPLQDSEISYGKVSERRSTKKA